MPGGTCRIEDPGRRRGGAAEAATTAAIPRRGAPQDRARRQSRGADMAGPSVPAVLDQGSAGTSGAGCRHGFRDAVGGATSLPSPSSATSSRRRRTPGHEQSPVTVMEAKPEPPATTESAPTSQPPSPASAPENEVATAPAGESMPPQESAADDGERKVIVGGMLRPKPRPETSNCRAHRPNRLSPGAEAAAKPSPGIETKGGQRLIVGPAVLGRTRYRRHPRSPRWREASESSRPDWRSRCGPFQEPQRRAGSGRTTGGSMQRKGHFGFAIDGGDRTRSFSWRCRGNTRRRSNWISSRMPPPPRC